MMKRSAGNSKANVSNAAIEAGEKADLGAKPQDVVAETPKKRGAASKRSKKSEKTATSPEITPDAEEKTPVKKSPRLKKSTEVSDVGEPTSVKKSSRLKKSAEVSDVGEPTSVKKTSRLKKSTEVAEAGEPTSVKKTARSRKSAKTAEVREVGEPTSLKKTPRSRKSAVVAEIGESTPVKKSTRSRKSAEAAASGESLTASGTKNGKRGEILTAEVGDGSSPLDALRAVFANVESQLSDAEKERRRNAENERKTRRTVASDSDFPLDLPPWPPGWLIARGARQNNLKSIDVPFPISALVAVTGVSGSGKSSLVENVLYRNLARILNRSQVRAGSCDELVGVDKINKVVQVDQAPIGQTPTSNPATYVGVFDLIRRLYAETPEAKTRGYTPRRFSFNAPGGRCEKCEGSGLLKIEMHFLADVWITCDACGGKRYDAQTLEVKFRGKSIADALELTCGDALKLFERIPPIARILRTLCDVGLDYLTLGQPSPTLSGGEAQRVKLAAELSRIDSGKTFYIIDEPTTGLHFEDVRKLLDVLHRLVDLGNTVVVVEHNLDVIKNADWIIDVGPEAGLEGGRLVFAGTPERLAEYSARWLSASEEERRTTLRSHTGEALIDVFREGTFAERPVLDVKEYWASQKTPTIESEEVAEELGSESVATPWETDGRRWHCETRTSRVGTPCRWSGKALAAVVDRLEESPLLAETDWNNRTIVEIRAEKKTLGWFFHALTSEEWLLKLKFRTALDTFDQATLVRKLDLKPLNDVDEIPLYGTQPRVKVETAGHWQEIELKVFSFEEIDRPEFWAFLDRAVERFGEAVERAKENEIDLTPWKTQGREWHMSPGGFYGGSVKARWPFGILLKTFEIVESISAESKPVWTNKIVVPFFEKGAKRPWCQVYTKNCDFVCVQINAPKGTVPLGRVADVGFEPEVDASNADFDAVYLRFRTRNEFNAEKLRELLQETFDKIQTENG
ncbi:MAG: ATP-binding cassette domain-containing protein [Thermoguttaceae bacterium]|nr:ATP-binding cassette domain-containing protein [Thermoguttaceae bacterium]